MTTVNPYLLFNGDCRAAMTFYEKCFGGELTLLPFSDAPPEAKPPGGDDMIFHATLKKGDLVLMASDCPPGNEVQAGANVNLSVNCANMDEIKTLFKAVSAGGEVKMPLQDTFWGAHFGMLVDKFGINWMFNYDKR